MIHFFTDPYKDELIYSAIARYHYYTGNIDYKDTLEELFEKRSIIPSLEIGSYMDVLANNLGGRHKAENIIRNHTIFHFYAPFLPMKRKNELLEEIKYEDGSGLYSKLGMVAGSICRKNGIYYCPSCAQKEIDKYGEAYIHKEHQLQGVFICPHHGIELKKYSVDKTNSSRIEFIRLDNKLLDLEDVRGVSSAYYDKLYKISKDAYHLLQLDLDYISKEKLLKRYKNMLYEKGLTTTSKRIKQRELYEEFIGFYGREFLKLMESDIDNDDEYNWLRVATRDVSRSVHPIRHLLLINFLDDNIERFFSNINDVFSPFGNGPWPCLNKAADHYKRNVINDVKITEDYKTRVPVGTFSCNCGFVYSRKGPDKSGEDKYKIGRVKRFGGVWEEKLKEHLSNQKYGVIELAKIMACDPKTIVKYGELLNEDCFSNSIDNTDERKIDKQNDVNIMELYKKQILMYIDENPSLTRTQVRDNCKKEYIYLYRKDKNWLYINLPKKIKEIHSNKVVEWDKRDEELLVIIKAKYEAWIYENVDIRITISSLGKALGVLSVLEKRIDKLPITKEYLNKILESVEEFQLRRCKKIIDNKIESRDQIRLWEIQRLAGLRSESFKRLEEEILKYISQRNNRGGDGEDSYEDKGVAFQKGGKGKVNMDWRTFKAK